MNLLEAILYGLIQGITEFLPVSSSGHLTLLGRILSTDEAAMLSLTTWLHAGTLISVFVVMRREIRAILKDLLGLQMRLIVLATIPAVLAAFLLGDLIDSLFGGSMLGYSFLLTAVILAVSLLSRRVDPAPVQGAAAAPGENRDGSQEIGYRQALAAGLGQAIAIAPGVSRSGSTLSALLLCKVSRQKAIRFSFLMSIPAILGGFLLDVVDLVRGDGGALLQLGIGNILVGILAAALSGYLAMEFMLRRLSRRGFLICAIYTALLGLLVLLDQSVLHLVFT